MRAYITSVYADLYSTSRILFSKTLQETIPRKQRLYRHALKLIPWTRSTYELDFTVRHMKNVIRSKFDENTELRDLSKIDQVLLDGENRVQEVMNTWQTRSHVVEFFTPKVRDTRTFIERIEAGEDVDDAYVEEWDVNFHYPPKTHPFQNMKWGYQSPYEALNTKKK